MLSALAFTHAWVLTALIALPLIWWLLRLIPPAPRLARFPPIRLLFDLVGREETPVRAPPWLIVLRLFLASLVILALAGPVFNPGARPGGDGPLLLVIDDGWTAAEHWPDRLDAMDRYIEQAERARQPVILLATAPAPGPATEAPPPLVAMSAAKARSVARAMIPKPWPVDRTAALARLEPGTLPANAHAVWLSDGLDDPGATALAAGLRKVDGLRVVGPRVDNLALALLPLDRAAADPAVRVARAPTPRALSVWVRASASDGHLLARARIDIMAGAARGSASLGLPMALRNQIARIEIADHRSAGTAMLADSRWRRYSVGLVSGQAIESAQPLLSDLYYLRKALEPITELRQGPLTKMISTGVQVLVLADIGALPKTERDALEAWVEAGGVLIRFAGPKLADSTDNTLLPVALRRGGRSMGGVMSWEQPAHLAPLDPTGPFQGLALPEDILVARQVLAEPGPEVAARAWARLEDGTPLVTGARQGDGWIILFHVTANTEWSDLPLSGLFVDMLERLVRLAQGGTAPRGKTRALVPLLLMDGFGSLGAPDPSVTPLEIGEHVDSRAGAGHPPGYYGPREAPLALNLMAPGGPIDDDFTLTPMVPPEGADKALYGTGQERPLGPSLLALALVLGLVDFVLGLALRGLLRPHRGLPVVLAVVAFGLLTAATAKAQIPARERATLEVRLAYVETGDRRIDTLSRSGLYQLGEVLRRRTTVSPAPPAAIDLAGDELIFHPLIYWPLTGREAPLSDQALRNVSKYLTTGGILLVDTRGLTPATRSLRKALGRLDIPALVPLPEDHVLTKTFYLLNRIPAFRANGEIWVERHLGGVNDEVSALIIVSGDWAATWARGNSRRSRPAQGEAAFRFGVNLVMYALTGNYKADQVHVPALLERLGK